MTMQRLLRSELRNVARSRWLLVYAIVLLGLTDLLFRFGGSGERVVLSLTNVILALVPLVGLVLGAMHVYQSREFIELMLAQPVGRRTLFGALYAGLALPLAAAYALGVGLPLLWHGQLLRGAGGITLLLAGVALTLVFTAIAFLIALCFEERAAGLGAAIVAWLLTVVVYDGLLLLAVVSSMTGRWRSRPWSRHCSIRSTLAGCCSCSGSTSARSPATPARSSPDSWAEGRRWASRLPRSRCGRWSLLPSGSGAFSGETGSPIWRAGELAIWRLDLRSLARELASSPDG